MTRITFLWYVYSTIRKKAMSLKSRLKGPAALSPALLFPILYLGCSLAMGDFYAMPLSIALGIAAVWGMAIYRGRPLHERIATFSQAAGNDTVLYMVWIFIMAGAFASLAKGIGAVDATVRLTLAVCPPGFVLPSFFMASCLISMSIGTSVGTVVALTPLATGMATDIGSSVPLYVAAVLSGAFFGDNLSFISDTTIAATRTQGCAMSDKFKANVRIAVPAAVVSLIIYTIIGFDSDMVMKSTDVSWADAWLVAPYLLVIGLAVAGVNVLIVLLSGIIAALICSLQTDLSIWDATSLLGEGATSMGELIIITLLAAGVLGLVKAMGGIDYLMRVIAAAKPGYRGAQALMCMLTALVNLCTANNTMAILTAGSLSRTISQHYGVSARRAASLLDTSSCIMQCLIPYGAQALLAAGMAGISPAAPWPYLFYPWLLALSLSVAVATKGSRHMVPATEKIA